MHLKILTLNIWNLNDPLELRMNLLQENLKKIKPEIICFQEVSLINGKPQVSQMMDSLQYSLVYQKSGMWQGREEGLAIATNLPVVEVKHYFLPMEHAYNDMQRILQKVIVQYNSKTICILNTHLAYHIKSGLCRVIQMDFIGSVISFLKTKYDYIILCGDFNCFELELTHVESFIKKSFLIDSALEKKKTFSSDNPYVSAELWPNRRIDFILSNNKDLISNICMCNNDRLSICTDHYGVLGQGEF